MAPGLGLSLAGSVRRSVVDVLLILAALAAALGVFLTGDRPTSGELDARRDNLLASFRPEELERITIVRGTSRVVIERGRGEAPSTTSGALDQRTLTEWRISEPIRAPASASHVRELVSALEVARIVRRLDARPADPAAFGLAAPRAIVSLEMGAVTYRLALGGPAPTPSGAAYLDVGGEGVARPGIVIIPASLVAKLDVGVDQFRQRRLSPYYPDDLESLVLERDGARLALRREVRRWRLQGSSGDRLVERRAIDGILTRIGELDVERVAPVPGSERAAGAVRVLLSPSDRSRPRVVIQLGGACPDGAGTIAARLEPEPIAGCVDEELREALVVTPDALLSRRPFSLAADEVEELVVIGGGKRLELARSGDAFALRAPRQGKVELEAGNRRLAGIVEVRGALVEAPDLSALGLSEPRASVTLRSSGASEAEIMSETVDVGAPDASGTVHLRRRADGAVLRVHADSARAFLPDATLLEPAEILELSPKQIQRVEVQGTTRQKLEQSATGGFRLVEPAGYPVDAALATDLVESLAGLRAERWVADQDDGSFGLRAPALRIKLAHEEREGARAERELVVGNPTTGGSFAQISGRPGVFVLARRVAAVLDRWLIDRAGVSVDLSGVRRIELVTSRGRLVLEQVGEGFEQVEGADVLGAAAIQELTDALAALRPEAALHPGAGSPAEGLQRPELEIHIAYEPGRTGPRHLRFGASGMWRGAVVQYARSDSVDATFVVARERVTSLLALLP